jgi:hypothetical protein
MVSKDRLIDEWQTGRDLKRSLHSLSYTIPILDWRKREKQQKPRRGRLPLMKFKPSNSKSEKSLNTSSVTLIFSNKILKYRTSTVIVNNDL